jgi:hypothetical protein
MITADLDPSLLSLRSDKLNKVAECVQKKVMEVLELDRIQTNELATTPSKKRKRPLQPTMGGVADRLKDISLASLSTYPLRQNGAEFGTFSDFGAEFGT